MASLWQLPCVERKYNLKTTSNCTRSYIFLTNKALYAVMPADTRFNIPMTAVTITFGLLKFVQISFEVQTVAMTLCRIIDKVLDAMPFSHAYINDILIAINAEGD